MQTTTILLLLGLLLVLLLLWRSFLRARRRRADRAESNRVSQYIQAASRVERRSSYGPGEKARLLAQQIQVARARRACIAALRGPQVALISQIRQRALFKYQEEEGVSWEEAVWDVADLEGSFVDGGQRGADPRVTYLLLQAGLRDDAIAYFCQSTGADSAEAVQAVGYFEALIAAGRTSFLEETRAPDPGAIRFFMRLGYKLLAIRYYRQCTGADLITAKTVVENISG